MEAVSDWVREMNGTGEQFPSDVRAIAAAARNRVIGAGGRLPWNLPEDVSYLHDCVRGSVVVEGRNCYESRGRAFPGAAETVVLSSRADWRPPDARVCPSLPSALAVAGAAGSPVWIAGGERLYAEGFPYCRRLYLTLIEAEFDGDTFLPEWERLFPVEVSRRTSSADGLRYSFLVLERRERPRESP